MVGHSPGTNVQILTQGQCHQSPEVKMSKKIANNSIQNRESRQQIKMLLIQISKYFSVSESQRTEGSGHYE